MTPGEIQTNDAEKSLISTRRLLALVIFSVVVFALVGLVGRVDEVIAALASIQWFWVVPAMMGLSLLNYVLRYVK